MIEKIRVYWFYKNGNYTTKLIELKEVDDFIDYHKVYRFGCALFVRQNCKYDGYLNKEEIEEAIKKINIKESE